MDEDLRPTIWRTLRVLANPNRLRVLQSLALLSPQSVSQIAAAACLSMSQASQILRALQARGLIQANRRGAWVFYTLEPNPAIAYGAPLAAALRQILPTCGTDFQPAMAALTAFTHERRIRMVRAIANGADTRPVLADSCHLCEQALGRHLGKLLRRGIVLEQDHRLTIAPQTTPLASTLLSLVQQDSPRTP
jgi:DNA-binding transcriptional ArsR family regulator